MNLNDTQRQAVEYSNGPLLIIAGAGTGKTTVITQRIEHLIKKEGLRPDELVALTFTEKAAGEMVERLDMVMPFGYEEPWIYTFHGFCDRILKTEGLELGLSPEYKVMSGPAQWLLIKRHIFELGLKYYAPLNNPNKFIRALIGFFSRLQDEDVSLEEITNYELRIKNINSKCHSGMADKPSPESFPNKKKDTEVGSKPAQYDIGFEELELQEKYHELFKAYEKYQQLKLEENVLDFGDLISKTIELFRKRPSVLAKYRKQFKHILVDEFQDTNFSQLQLIKLLAPPESKPNLAVVGDDDQAIYAFRGSSVHNILDFKKHYPQAQEVVLTTNYRSGQPILNAAYSSVKNNNPDRLETLLKIDKQLVAARGKKLPHPQIIEVDTLEQEADFVIEKTLQLIGKDFTYKDVAVLARANAHLDPFVAALRRAGLPYQLIGNRGLFDQDEVRDLMFFLKVVADPTDSTSLFYFLHNQILGLQPQELVQLLNQAKTRSESLWEILQSHKATDKRYQAIIDYVENAQKKDCKRAITEILHDFVDASSYITLFTQDDTLESQLKLKNINLYFNKLKGYDQEYKNSSIADCVEYFNLLIEAGENPAQAEIEDVDTISLLTIHASKGLEWPVVFLVNMVADRFPSRDRSEAIELPQEFIKQSLPTGNAHLQEERRLFYVAITRARDYLFAVYGKDYGGARSKRPSGFLKELGVDTLPWKPTGGQLSWLTGAKGVTAPKPREVVDGEVKLDFTSYSQIDTYDTCPLRFKYQYVLQVPTKPNYNITFGSTIHNTLQKFHRFEINGQQPDFDILLHIYKKEFQYMGYDSEEHRLLRFAAGKEALRKYFQNYKQQFDGQPKSLEISFKITLDGIPLVGRIDRVDELPGGGLELIDYKTGSVRDQKEVDKDVQLTVYSIASQLIFGKLPDKLSLYFVEDGVKVSTTRSAEQLEKTKESIIATIAKIKSGDFEAKAGSPFPCDFCPYKQICPAAKRG